MAISVRRLTHRYPSPEGTLEVLSDVELEVPGDGYVAVTGPSGAGKSTLLSLLGGLEPLQEGTALVGDTDLAGLGGDDLAAYRQATVGFVFQHFGLLEALTAAENVELAGTLAGMGRAARRRRAAELLDAVGLAHRAGHQPLQLSGGERQRAAIARALANPATSAPNRISATTTKGSPRPRAQGLAPSEPCAASASGRAMRSRSSCRPRRGWLSRGSGVLEDGEELVLFIGVMSSIRNRPRSPIGSTSRRISAMVAGVDEEAGWLAGCPTCSLLGSSHERIADCAVGESQWVGPFRADPG